jgi:hypothetical protein
VGPEEPMARCATKAPSSGEERNSTCQASLQAGLLGIGNIMLKEVSLVVTKFIFQIRCLQLGIHIYLAYDLFIKTNIFSELAYVVHIQIVSFCNM